MSGLEIKLKHRGIAYIAKLRDESDGRRYTFDVALHRAGEDAPMALGMWDHMCLDFGYAHAVPEAVYERLHDKLEEITKEAELEREDSDDR